ncbi:hypothetical protein HED50_12830 [Ochrobactrum oryzae]|nr:hypothetical protein [Brucella oryzae]
MGTLILSGNNSYTGAPQSMVECCKLQVIPILAQYPAPCHSTMEVCTRQPISAPAVM